MAEHTEGETSGRMGALLLEAFLAAYPEISAEHASHAARNLAQVISGAVDIGRKAGGGAEVTHMDVANALVYWCTTGTSLEACHRDADGGGGEVSTWPRREGREMLAARAADFMLAFNVLSGEPELMSAFIRGTLVLGTSGWERDRGRTRY